MLMFNLGRKARVQVLKNRWLRDWEGVFDYIVDLITCCFCGDSMLVGVGLMSNSTLCPCWDFDGVGFFSWSCFEVVGLLSICLFWFCFYCWNYPARIVSFFFSPFSFVRSLLQVLESCLYINSRWSIQWALSELWRCNLVFKLKSSFLCFLASERLGLALAIPLSAKVKQNRRRGRGCILWG